MKLEAGPFRTWATGRACSSGAGLHRVPLGVEVVCPLLHGQVAGKRVWVGGSISTSCCRRLFRQSRLQLLCIDHGPAQNRSIRRIVLSTRIDDKTGSARNANQCALARSPRLLEAGHHHVGAEHARSDVGGIQLVVADHDASARAAAISIDEVLSVDRASSLQLQEDLKCQLPGERRSRVQPRRPLLSAATTVLLMARGSPAASPAHSGRSGALGAD